MKHPFKLFLIIAALAVTQFAQTKTSGIKSVEITAETMSAEIKQHIPEGYVFLKAMSGDLNLDKIADVVLVVKKPNEAETSDVNDNPEKRPLLVLLGEGAGKYALAARNDTVVLCVNCGGVFGDPFDGISIKNGFFSIEHYGGSNWRWTKIITFKYSKEDETWHLSRIGSDSYHTSNPNKSEKKVKTIRDFGRVFFENYDGTKDDM